MPCGYPQKKSDDMAEVAVALLFFGLGDGILGLIGERGRPSEAMNFFEKRFLDLQKL